MVPGAKDDTPVTMPDKEPTVATATSLLLHVPPGVELKRVVVAPSHTLAIPVIAAGVRFTVTVVNARQPPPTMYVILAVPAASPVTTPVPDATVAIEILPLVHTPPAGALDNVILPSTHTVPAPVIGIGVTDTDTVFEAKQPVVGMM